MVEQLLQTPPPVVCNNKAFEMNWGDRALKPFSETPGVVSNKVNVTPSMAPTNEGNYEKCRTLRENKNKQYYKGDGDN